MNNLLNSINDALDILTSIEIPATLENDRADTITQVGEAVVAIEQEYRSDPPDPYAQDKITEKTKKQVYTITNALGKFDTKGLVWLD